MKEYYLGLCEILTNPAFGCSTWKVRTNAGRKKIGQTKLSQLTNRYRCSNGKYSCNYGSYQ